MTQTSLPAARAAFIDQSGRPTPEFYRFLETPATAQAGNVSPDEITAINAQLAELQAEIAALPSAEIPKLQVTYPILSQGLLQNGFAKLALNQPGDSGTGALKGITLDAWGRVTGTTDATITGTAGRVTVTNGNAAAGVPTIDLAEVADTGGGSLLKIVRDAWGRITGTSTPTTTDLAEGSNLYFTAARVLATVLAGLSTTTNAVITAADSVLVALGKLQAQITANVATLAGKLTASNNLSDVANKTTALSNLGGATAAQGALAATAVQPNTNAQVNLAIKDTRDVFLSPYVNTANKAVALDFKRSLATNTPVSNAPGAGYTLSLPPYYANVLTLSPWSDPSGGMPVQIGFGTDGNLYYRIATNWEGTSGKLSLLPWAASTAYSSQTPIIPASSTPNFFFFKCTTPGTSGATEPVWPTTTGGTVTDGTCVWTAVPLWGPWSFIPTCVAATAMPISGGAFTGPATPAQYTLTTLPSASTFKYATIVVTNATGGPALCISDGTNWNRVSTGGAVS